MVTVLYTIIRLNVGERSDPTSRSISSTATKGVARDLALLSPLALPAISGWWSRV